jgi:hypothetical protein
MHCQQAMDANADLADITYREMLEREYREKLEKEQRDEDAARAIQEQWQAETDNDRAAREKSDEKMAQRYNGEELANVDAGSLALNRGKRSLTKKYVCDACGNTYTTKGSLRRHQQTCSVTLARKRSQHSLFSCSPLPMRTRTMVLICNRSSCMTLTTVMTMRTMVIVKTMTAVKVTATRITIRCGCNWWVDVQFLGTLHSTRMQQAIHMHGLAVQIVTHTALSRRKKD